MKYTLRILSILLLLPLLFGLIACGDKEPDPVPYSQGLAYKVNADGTSCTITGMGTCKDTALNIPPEIDGYTVTALADGKFEFIFDPATEINIWTEVSPAPFSDRSTLTSVTLPDTVKAIGDYAFQGCKNLLSVDLGNGVVQIGEGAFQNCTALESVTLSSSLTTIEDEAFRNCLSLESITLPASLTHLGQGLFSYAARLTSITYEGTKASFQAMSARNWNLGISDVVIYCTDGNLLY